MHMARQLTDQGRERKQQLLDAAERLFTERGYANTRIADICEAAGVAKGLFYWYFDTKAELFADLVRSVRQQLRRAQAAAMDDGADPVTRIRQGAEASVRFMSEHMAFFAVVRDVGKEGVIAPVLSESADVYTGDIERLVEKAKADGQIAEDLDTHLLAVGVLSLVSTFANQRRMRQLDLDVDGLAGFVGAFVVRALTGT